MNKQSRFTPSLQILCAIAAGAVAGCVAPAWAARTQPVADLFLDVVRLLVGPVIFCSVASAIAAMHNMRQLGEAGIKALFYFEAVAVLALAAGIGGAWLLQPGAGLPVADGAQLAAHAAELSLASAVQATLAQNRALQLLFCAIGVGVALALAGARAQGAVRLLERGAGWLLALVNLILKAAPVAAFAAVAFTVSRYGLPSMLPLLKLLGALYLTTIAFVVLVFGLVARCAGFSLWRFILAIREELILVFGTSSSVAAMPRLIGKLEQAGCAPAITRLVVPAGYSFNLSGSNIYLTLALVFLAQSAHIALTVSQYALILAVAMITSKGASGIAGSAFVVLGATVAVVPEIDSASLLYIFTIERLLKCRPLANIIGNGVAAIAVAGWMGKLDRNRLRAWLA